MSSSPSPSGSGEHAAARDSGGRVERLSTPEAADERNHPEPGSSPGRPSDAASTLEVYLRGGQVLTLTVTDWSFKKSPVSNEISEFSWMMANDDRMPFISLGDITAVIERG